MSKRELSPIEESKSSSSDFSSGSLELSFVLAEDDPKQVSFLYNLSTDTPESVADEMLQEFCITSSHKPSIAALIRSQVLAGIRPINNSDEQNAHKSVKSYVLKNYEHLSNENYPILGKTTPIYDKNLVKKLQGKVAKALGVSIQKTGVFSESFEALVKQLQRKYQIDPDGIITPKFLRLLKEESRIRPTFHC